jgi:protein-tyrosine-phosphatase
VTPGSEVEIRGVLTNTGDATIDDLDVRLQRGDVLTSREALAELDAEVRLGDPVVELAGRPLAVTFAPVPGFRRRSAALDVAALHSVLFVCHGNIIRSALAAELTRHHAKQLGLTCDGVVSGGVFAKAGREADARAVAAGANLGIDLRSHRAQPLTPPLIDNASVIYVMDRLNESELLARFPRAASKLRRLGAIATGDRGDLIADPYVLDAAAVATVAQRIDRATRVLAAELARRGGHERSTRK